MFKTENRFLFEMLSCGNDKKKMKSILNKNSNYRKLDRVTVDTVSEILYLDISWKLFAKIDEDGREVYDVCKAFEDYKEEGREEGKQEMAIEMINNLMKSQKVTFEVAADMLGLSKSSQK